MGGSLLASQELGRSSLPSRSRAAAYVRLQRGGILNRPFGPQPGLFTKREQSALRARTLPVSWTACFCPRNLDFTPRSVPLEFIGLNWKKIRSPAVLDSSALNPPFPKGGHRLSPPLQKGEAVTQWGMDPNAPVHFQLFRFLCGCMDQGSSLGGEDLTLLCEKGGLGDSCPPLKKGGPGGFNSLRTSNCARWVQCVKPMRGRTQELASWYSSCQAI